MRCDMVNPLKNLQEQRNDPSTQGMIFLGINLNHISRSWNFKNKLCISSSATWTVACICKTYFHHRMFGINMTSCKVKLSSVKYNFFLKTFLYTRGNFKNWYEVRRNLFFLAPYFPFKFVLLMSYIVQAETTYYTVGSMILNWSPTYAKWRLYLLYRRQHYTKLRPICAKWRLYLLYRTQHYTKLRPHMCQAETVHLIPQAALY